MSVPTEPDEPTKAVDAPDLPPEIWLLIFRFATSADTSTEAPYEPFQPCPDTAAALSDVAVRVKCVLTLVCKRWRALAQDVLYEDVRIGPGLSALSAALCEPPANSEDDDDAAPRAPRHRVRRAVLPYAHTATPTRDALPALALLALLPHLEVLVRPPPKHIYNHDYDRTYQYTNNHCAPTPALPAPRRLEWAFDMTGDAPRVGGINALGDVLDAAPNLRELVLVGRMPYRAVRQKHPRLRQCALRTLRLHGGAAACPFVARQTTYWEFPALENVVVTGAADAKALEAVWEAFGDQVRVLEVPLGGGGGGGDDCGEASLSMADVGGIISACPKLEELNVRLGVEGFENSAAWDSSEVGIGAVTRTWACAHDTLQRVGICIDAPGGEWTAKTWTAVIEYAAQFEKGCPALRCVALYVPDVRVAAQNPQFDALRETLMSSGRRLLLRSVHAKSECVFSNTLWCNIEYGTACRGHRESE